MTLAVFTYGAFIYSFSILHGKGAQDRRRMMNVASSPESAARRTELDPFEVRRIVLATTVRRCGNAPEARLQAEAEFGCVDWYQYQVSTAENNDALKKAPAAQ
jgi:hypothetical protein